MFMRTLCSRAISEGRCEPTMGEGQGWVTGIWGNRWDGWVWELGWGDQVLGNKVGVTGSGGTGLEGLGLGLG